MWNRRQMMLGACCALHVVSRGAGQAQEERPEFLCAAVEPNEAESGRFQIQHFGASNAPSQMEIDRAQKEFDLSLFGAAFLQDRWRPEDGVTPNTGIVTLGVFFMDGDASRHEAVRKAASQWLKASPQRLAFDFAAPQEKSQIRIGFARGEGNYSAIGRKALDSKPSAKTMNIEDVIPPVILHEFGHALGLRHEHNHPRATIRWDEKRVIEDMAAYGWTAEMTRHNILERYTKEAACIGDPKFNRRSIMIYPIPKRWTTNGFSSEQTTEISERDHKCVAGLYGI